MPSKKRTGSPESPDASAPPTATTTESRAEDSPSDEDFSPDPAGPSQIKALLWPAMVRIEEIQRSGKSVSGIPSGFSDLDALTAGFQPGEVLVVAGRPSMGKTAFALNVAAHVTMEHNISTAFFTLESTYEATITRLLAAESRVEASRLRKGTLRDSDFPRLARAAGMLSGAPLWVSELPSRKFEELTQKIRRLHSENGVALVVVDYLQLLEGPLARAENRNQELAAMSRGLKGLAKELRISIMVLAQCSRAPDQRNDHRPWLTDVRDSGAIEEDADVVLFLYRQEIYDGPFDRDGEPIEGKAEVLIAKQRGGPAAHINLFFQSHYARFDSYTRQPA